MIVKEFTQKDKDSFFDLCKMFYESEATIRSYDEAITQKTFSRILDRHENLWGYMLVDNDEQCPIGYALITSYWSNEEGGDVIVLDELYIAQANRKKGYAKIFMSWLENHFTDSVAITLEVLTSNHKACDLYSKAGYKPDGYVTYTKALIR